MAIQMRRGAVGNLDRTKLLPGEWAICTDGTIVICYASGKTVDVVTKNNIDRHVLKIENSGNDVYTVYYSDNSTEKLTIKSGVEIDNTLTVSGKAADSKVVGDMLSQISEDKHVFASIKEWNLMGDSITFGSGLTDATQLYHQVIKNKYGITTVNNYAHSGTSITYGGTRPEYSFCRIYGSMSDTADLITVFGGANDYQDDIELGSFSDTVDTTFYGAMRILCEGLLNKYPDRLIFFFTPLKYKDTPNNNGTYLEEYVTAIKKVCSYYTIPVIDLFTTALLNPLVPIFKTNYFIDDGLWLHPNEKGHRDKIVPAIIAGMSGYNISKTDITVDPDDPEPVETDINTRSMWEQGHIVSTSGINGLSTASAYNFNIRTIDYLPDTVTTIGGNCRFAVFKYTQDGTFVERIGGTSYYYNSIDFTDFDHTNYKYRIELASTGDNVNVTADDYSLMYIISLKA